MELKYVDLPTAVARARPGWLVQYRGRGWFSPFVRFFTGGSHTHSAMVTGFGEISEVREFVGGRISTFEFQVKRFNGCMDFFSIREEFRDPAGVTRTVRTMREMAKTCRYDYWNVTIIALRNVPGFHLILPGGLHDDEPCKNEPARHCSDAVCAAYACGLIDPVPRWPDRLVVPHDLTRSLMFRYEFSL